jgi:acetyltransferase
MSTSIITDYPSQHERRLTLKDGREVFFRPIMPTDGNLLVDLYNKISPQNLYMRFLSHIQALPEDLLYHFTHVDYYRESALVAVVKEEGDDAIIGVARYAYDTEEDLTDLAVAVRDDWQHVGMGKALLDNIIAIGKEHGITRFVSMMDPRNSFIGQVLKRLGYNVTYSLRSGYFLVEILV